ncbi:hypothetical protein Droror1_Dr00010142 [Drosera rotundifolia]
MVMSEGRISRSTVSDGEEKGDEEMLMMVEKEEKEMRLVSSEKSLKGILFVAIDPNRSFSEQGPFDIVLHKLSGKAWREILEDYRQTHPDVTVLDPPDAIQHVRNRQSMLQEVADLNLSNSYGKVGVPTQLVIQIVYPRRCCPSWLNVSSSCKAAVCGWKCEVTRIIPSI